MTAYHVSEAAIGACGMAKKNRVALGLRQCGSIGLWACDRGGWTCHRTAGCRDCYVQRSTQVYKYTRQAWSRGGVDDQGWNRITAATFKGLARVRICTRGEPFHTAADVYKVAGWVLENPTTKFWIPTRRWTTGLSHGWNAEFVRLIERHVMILPNAFVQASVDPYTAHMFPRLIAHGWSTMYFESSVTPADYPKGLHPVERTGNMVYCPKTWNLIINSHGRVSAKHGQCRTCNHCFGPSRVDVWLKNHLKAYRDSDLPGGATGKPLN